MTLPFFTIVTSTLSLRAGIIPPDRRIDWSDPGVPGGIPHRTVIFRTIDDDAYGNGSTDAAAVIQTALDECPDGQVVFLPSGTYTINGRLHVGSNVTMRGDGPGRSILAFVGSGRSALYMDANAVPRDTVSITGGMQKGSTVITVNSTSAMSVGDLLFIDQLNDGILVDANGVEGFCTYCGREEGKRTLGQIVRITAIDKASDKLTTHLPLNFTYTDTLLPQAELVYARNFVDKAGVEDLTVTQPSPLYTYLVEMQGTQNCWLRNVEIEKVDWRAVWLLHGVNNEIRDCYFHHSVNGYGRSHGYGVLVDLISTANLVENNVFVTIDGGGAMTGGGATGNVIAYNIIADPRFDDPWWATASPSTNHNPHPMMNLWEGNRGDKLEGDFIHGSSSHNTVFRSYSRGWTRDSATAANAAVALAKKNTYYNIVGCILGTPGKSNVYEVVAGQAWNNADRVIWLLGVTCEVEGPEVLHTLYRHGNFDYVTNSVKWDSTVSDHTLPASLYLMERPFFFEKVPWPPIGPDVEGYYNKIPAERWLDQLMSAAANTAPIAAACEVSTAVNTPVAVKPSATDAEDDQLRFFIVNDGAPSHGTLFWDDEGLVYRPADGYTGADSFAFVADDGRAVSNSAKVRIAVGGAAVTGKTAAAGFAASMCIVAGQSVIINLPAGLKNATLTIYSLSGERVAFYRHAAGKQISWRPGHRPGGLYIATVRSGNETITARFLLAR